jgi:uncharacterized protein (DUF488 family)
MRESSEEHRLHVFTVGHSNRPMDDFLSLLKVYAIRSLVDVRSVPSSSRYLQYDQAALESRLTDCGITYHWFQDLGGWRRGRGEDSPNLGLHAGADRNYADYMLTGAFVTAIGRLLGIARIRLTVILCAERDPGRCHRRLISDYLVTRGTDVDHIWDEETCTRHHLTKHAALTVDHKLVYPAHHRPGQDLLFET